jgi:hypothetical protein
VERTVEVEVVELMLAAGSRHNSTARGAPCVFLGYAVARARLCSLLRLVSKVFKGRVKGLRANNEKMLVARSARNQQVSPSKILFTYTTRHAYLKR